MQTACVPYREIAAFVTFQYQIISSYINCQQDAKAEIFQDVTFDIAAYNAKCL